MNAPIRPRLVHLLLPVAFVAALLLAAAPAHAQLSLSWLTQYGTSSNDFVRAIEVDALGQSWVSGHTQGNLGGTNAGSYDVFLSQLSPTGVVNFSRLRGGDGDDGAYGIALVGGSTVFTGGFANSSTFDSATALGDNDALNVRYNTSGVWQGTTRYGSSGSDLIYALAGNSTHLFAGGETAGSFDSQTNSGGTAAFLSKRDSTGALVWTRFAQGTGDASGFGVNVDGAGNSYVGGRTTGNFTGFSNAGGEDLFVARYDSLGNQTLLRQFGTTGDESVTDLEVDASGNIYLVGSTTGALNGQTNNGQNDIFLTKLDSSGNHLWTRLLGGANGEGATSIGLDVTGRIWVGGGSDSSFAGHTNAGSLDAIIAQYDPSGNLLGTFFFSTANYDVVTGLDVGLDGAAYITGDTDGSLGGPNAGNFDNFVAKVVPEPSAVVLLGGGLVGLLLRRRR